MGNLGVKVTIAEAFEISILSIFLLFPAYTFIGIPPL